MQIRKKTGKVLARKERARENARREILLAAAGVFARRGYAAATLAELAEAGGYAPASLYRYFEGKEEIFRSLLALVKGELAATFERPVDRALPLEERLAALLEPQLEHARRHSGFLAVLLHERPVLPADGQVDHLRSGLADYEAWLAAWLSRHVSPRELRCPREDAARALTGILHAFHHIPARPGDAEASPALVRRLLDLALHGLQARPSSRPHDQSPTSKEP